MWSNINFGKFALFAIAVSMAGCAGYTQQVRPTTTELSRFEPDCRIAEKQLIWLKSLLPSQDEKNWANSQVVIFGRLSKEYVANREVGNGQYDYIIKENIRALYRECTKSF
jgi:hypothetical protein